MPLYEFKCEQCGKIITEMYDMNGIRKPTCCGKRADRKYSTFTKIVDFRDGFDAGLGKYFNTARERNNYIAEKNLRRIKT